MDEKLGSAPELRVTEATRIPMSVPQLKLAAVKLPGKHPHWFLGKNVPAALRAGYTHRDPKDSTVPNSGLANSAAMDGSTDLGSRVSVPAGQDVNEHGDGESLYLMDIPEEWWDKDQKELEARNEAIAAKLRGGVDPATGRGPEGAYIPAVGNNLNMFTPKRRP